MASGISSYTKRKKNSVTCHAQDLNLGPLVYEASAISIEVSFRMKIYGKLMTLYTSFVVQQILISLTYPFNIVHYTLFITHYHTLLKTLS